MADKTLEVVVLWEQRFDPKAIEGRTREEIVKMMRAKCKYAHRSIQRSMKNVGKKSKTGKLHALAGQASPPGTAPHVHNSPGGDANMGGLRPLIRSAVLDENGTVTGYVGYVTSREELGKLHEFGGNRQIDNWRRIHRRVRQSGEYILPLGDPGPVGAEYVKPAVDLHGHPVNVLYRRSRTAKSAAQANRHNERLYGPDKVAARYPRRPAVGPVAQRMGMSMTQESQQRLLAALAAH